MLHDNGIKTVLGRTGNLNGEDVLREIVAQPQAARLHHAPKSGTSSPAQPPSEELNTALAGRVPAIGQQFQAAARRHVSQRGILRGPIVRNQVKSPVQWLVGSARVLERDLPQPAVCFALTRNLGQDLFAPPNVKGWDGGLSWITTNNLLARYNEAALLVAGRHFRACAALTLGGPKAAAAMQVQNRMRNMPRKAVDVEQNSDRGRTRATKTNSMAALEKRLLQAQAQAKSRKKPCATISIPRPPWTRTSFSTPSAS